ncbi:hypothetical protein EB796_008253 [Bugula neritina]|uniref:Uncharacterized protein n=1 Tax=Bugula neritina TaxID=10212 RepID=A0A7J7K5C6_BUGNE|nr:hypothetical protein EB796_008253 [Bugula neritina]
MKGLYDLDTSLVEYKFCTILIAIELLHVSDARKKNCVMAAIASQPASSFSIGRFISAKHNRAPNKQIRSETIIIFGKLRGLFF